MAGSGQGRRGTGRASTEAHGAGRRHKPIFVSHASEESFLARPFVRLLTEGCELTASNDVFFTSERVTGLDTGEYINAALQDTISRAGLVVAVITPLYMTRPVCLVELGAGWAFEKLFPILLPGMDRADLRGIVGDAVVYHLDNPDELDALHDRVMLVLGRQGRVTAWNPARGDWLSSLTSLTRRVADQPACDPAVARTPSAIPPLEVIAETNTWVDQPRITARRHFQTVAEFGLAATMEVTASIDGDRRVTPEEILAALRGAALPAFKWPFGKFAGIHDTSTTVGPDGVEALFIDKPTSDQQASFDYWRVDTFGRFYALASLYEDERPLETRGSLRWRMRAQRTAEALLFLARFLARMTGSPDQSVEVAIRYSGLLARTLGPPEDLLQPGRYTSVGNHVQVTQIARSAEIEARLYEYTRPVLAALFDLFENCPLDDAALRNEIDRFIDRTRPIELRVATVADAEALASLKRREEDTTYQSYGTAKQHLEGLATFCSSDYVVSLIEAPDQEVVVAEQGDRAVGMVAIRLETDEVWLHALYVAAKRRGVATKLIRKAAETAETRSRPFVRCEIFGNNVGAQAAFSRLGFQPTGEQRPSETYPTRSLHRYEASTSVLLSRTA